MHKRILLILNFVQQRGFIPLLRWAWRDLNLPSTLIECPGEYVQPSSVTPVLVLAAHEDRIGFHQGNAETFQSELNGCMEGARAGKIGGAMLSMLGGMVASGYDQEEAFIRVIANAMHLGMFMERRLSK